MTLWHWTIHRVRGRQPPGVRRTEAEKDAHPFLRGQPRQLLHHSSLAPIARLLDERDTVDDIQLDFTNIAVGEKDAASDGDDATVASEPASSSGPE